MRKGTLGEDLSALTVPDRTQGEACKFVLSQVKTIRKTKSTNSDSYWFKHRVEEALGLYVTNGAFIQAAAELGFQIEPLEELNAEFYISKKVFLEAVEDAVANGARAAVQNMMASSGQTSSALI